MRLPKELAMSFNLIVTHEHGGENYRAVLSELRRLLGEAVVVDAGPSIILLKVGDPYKAVEELKSASLTPLIYRVVPVDRVLDPFVEAVAEEAGRLAEERIPVDKTYRVTLHGRLYWRETRLPAHSSDAVRVIAEKINRRVSLTHPDYVVYVRCVKLYHRRRLATLTIAPVDKIVSLKSGKL
jgi:tRNA acetyltransferase TAN1